MNALEDGFRAMKHANILSKNASQSVKVSGTVFNLPPRYKFIKLIGHGAYGIVVSALDQFRNEKVAVKKIPHAFDDLVDAKRILREVLLLRQFDHENIISILDILPPPSLKSFEDVYIVSNLMETDLHRIIYSPQPLSIEHVQYFIYQILLALQCMHSANVLHRDLKPSNLLVNSNCALKVCDLGLARGISDNPQSDLTEYVVTRWYRAPEIMLACQEYTKAIDMWSVGCIFAELIQRVPLFPGEDYIHQLQIICQKLGRPNVEDLDFITGTKAKRFMTMLPPTKPADFRTLFPKVGDVAIDLLERMIVFHPGRRITVDDALKHPFMDPKAIYQSEYTQTEELPRASPIMLNFENEELDRSRLQELIWTEMLRYHPEISVTELDPMSNDSKDMISSTTNAENSLKRSYSHLGEEYGEDNASCSQDNEKRKRVCYRPKANNTDVNPQGPNMFGTTVNDLQEKSLSSSSFKKESIFMKWTKKGGFGEVLLAAAEVISSEETPDREIQM